RLLLHTTAPTPTSTLSLHDALPISRRGPGSKSRAARPGRRLRQLYVRTLMLLVWLAAAGAAAAAPPAAKLYKEGLRAEQAGKMADRKSTRLNSSHVKISYAVFCLKK